MTPRRGRSLYLGGALLLACAVHVPHVMQFDRPSQLVGQWVDLRHTSLGDTALWVLRDNGYDGSEHVVAHATSGGTTREDSSEHRYGTWYFTGALTDAAHRALCFAKRIGRDGPTCLAFDFDTATIDGLQRRRLTIHGYQGEHFTGDRTLLDRRAENPRR